LVIGDLRANIPCAEGALTLDVFLASHAGQFRMHDKYKPGDAYKVDRFVDPSGYRAAVDALEMTYRKHMADENKQP
jgi:metallo-beta-lactamase class B